MNVKLLDHFAGQALTGITSCPTAIAVITKLSKETGMSESCLIGKLCYEYAQALLDEKE